MKKFWTQFGITIAFGLIIPLTYVFIRFKLYNVRQTINIWFALAVALIFFCAANILKNI